MENVFSRFVRFGGKKLGVGSADQEIQREFEENSGFEGRKDYRNDVRKKARLISLTCKGCKIKQGYKVFRLHTPVGLILVY